MWEGTVIFAPQLKKGEGGEVFKTWYDAMKSVRGVLVFARYKDIKDVHVMLDAIANVPAHLLQKISWLYTEHALFEISLKKPEDNTEELRKELAEYLPGQVRLALTPMEG